MIVSDKPHVGQRFGRRRESHGARQMPAQTPYIIGNDDVDIVVPDNAYQPLRDFVRGRVNAPPQFRLIHRAGAAVGVVHDRTVLLAEIVHAVDDEIGHRRGVSGQVQAGVTHTFEHAAPFVHFERYAVRLADPVMCEQQFHRNSLLA